VLKVKVKVKGHVIRALLYWHEIASSGLLGYVELFIIHVKFAIYYFLHFNKVRQVAARLRAKSAIYGCLVADGDDDDIVVTGERRQRGSSLWSACWRHRGTSVWSAS